jgi:DNA-binding XRE family transcriptional regulator
MPLKRRRQLAIARKAAGYTQESLAEALHVDRATVIRWEAGRHLPVPYLWPKLAKLLGVTRERLQHLLVPEVEPDPTPSAMPTQQPNHAVTLEDMKRRTLMKWGAAATAAASLGATASSSVGMADVQRLQRSAARLHSLDQQHGGGSLWQAALAHAHDGTRLLEHGSYTGTVGQHLLAATGRLQICAGWLAFDAGHHDVAHSCFTDALAMSHQANDAQTETRALANLAMQCNNSARPREALRYAAGAEHAAKAHPGSSWLAAIPQLRLAIGSSLSGSARDADQAISDARRVLERDSDAESEEWLSFLTPFEIDGIEAVCAIELGRPEHAEKLLDQAISGYTQECARNRALYRIDLARARLDMGAVDGAVEAAHAAIDDLSGEVASWRADAELRVVAQRFADYAEVDGVEAFLARHEAVNH